MDADLDSLATGLYVTVDDVLRSHPQRVPARPVIEVAAADHWRGVSHLRHTYLPVQ